MVIMELHYHHPFSRVGIANYNVAQKTILISEIIERNAVAKGIVAYAVAYLVVKVVHEMATLYGQYLVEGSSNMKTNAIHVVIGITR